MAKQTAREAFEGLLGELVRPTARSHVIWLKGWHCQRCGHCWPLRKLHLPAVDPTGKGPTQVPKKCPACCSKDWTEPYKNKQYAGRATCGGTPCRPRIPPHDFRGNPLAPLAQGTPVVEDDASPANLPEKE